MNDECMDVFHSELDHRVLGVLFGEGLFQFGAVVWDDVVVSFVGGNVLIQAVTSWLQSPESNFSAPYFVILFQSN